jgi:hypothetical protein
MQLVVEDTIAVPFAVPSAWTSVGLEEPFPHEDAVLTWKDFILRFQ